MEKGIEYHWKKFIDKKYRKKADKPVCEFAIDKDFIRIKSQWEFKYTAIFSVYNRRS